MRCMNVLGIQGRPMPVCEREPGHDGQHRDNSIEWTDQGLWYYIRIDYTADGTLPGVIGDIVYADDLRRQHEAGFGPVRRLLARSARLRRWIWRWER